MQRNKVEFLEFFLMNMAKQMKIQEEQEETVLQYRDEFGKEKTLTTVFSFELKNGPCRYLVVTDGRRDRTGKKKLWLARYEKQAGVNAGWEFADHDEIQMLNPLIEMMMNQLSHHLN